MSYNALDLTVCVGLLLDNIKSLIPLLWATRIIKLKEIELQKIMIVSNWIKMSNECYKLCTNIINNIYIYK